jgi:SAM-dependent methyltransferase
VDDFRKTRKEKTMTRIDALRSALADPRPNPAARSEPDTRAAWDQIAPGYDRTNTPTQMRIASEGLRNAGLRSGMRFLDVAAGSGALSIPAARLGARVMAIDQSPVMLELLAARARKERLNVETRVMDGHALQLDDDTFDLAGSQFGVMLFTDVSRDGAGNQTGWPSAHTRVWRPAQDRIPQLFVAAVQSVRPDFDGPPVDPPPLEFQLADPDRLRGELSAAGLKDVKVETLTETTEHETGKDLWEWLVWSNPIVERILRAMLNLTDGERGVVRQTLDKLVRERAAGSRAARLTNPVNIGIGTKVTVDSELQPIASSPVYCPPAQGVKHEQA